MASLSLTHKQMSLAPDRDRRRHRRHLPDKRPGGKEQRDWQNIDQFTGRAARRAEADVRTRAPDPAPSSL